MSNLMSDSDSNISSKIVLAKWTDRFLAWLIDFIIISAISLAIVALIFDTTNVEWNENTIFSDFLGKVLFFAIHQVWNFFDVLNRVKLVCLRTTRRV